MQTTLVACCYESGNFNYPLGALSVQASLNARGHAAALENYTLSDDPVRAATKTTGKIVGCSVYLWNRQWFDLFAKTLKERNPSVILFAGGAEVTANPSSFPFGLWDFIVVGEGEEAVPRAVEEMEQGKTVKPGDGIVTKGSAITASCPEELSSLPSVLLSHAADKLLKTCPTVLWELTRGCPFHCGFCFESHGVRTVRHYPFERIAEELDYLLSHKVKDIFILDPTFNMDKERTKSILRLLVSKAQGVHFTFENRAELLDDEIISLFSQLDCSLQIGMQSANPKTLALVGRNAKQEQFEKNVKSLAKKNITFGLDLIIGLPEDTLTSFEHSLDTAISLRPSNIDIFLLSLLPGTMLCEKAEELHLIGDKENPYLVRKTAAMDEKDIKDALRLKKACDLFYTKGQSYMWFSVLTDAVGAKPHRLLSLFADYLDATGEERDIYEMQDDFVRKLLKQLGKKNLLPALTSYMELYQGIAFLLETGESPVIDLAYDPNELCDLETQSLEEFVETHKAQKESLAIVREDDGSISFLPQG